MYVKTEFAICIHPALPSDSAENKLKQNLHSENGLLNAKREQVKRERKKKKSETDMFYAWHVVELDKTLFST